MTLVFAWLALAVAGQEADGLGTLFRDLDSDRVDVRDAAAAALLERGGTILPELERALEGARTPEARGCLRAILARLRMRHEGGRRVKGLQVELAAETAEIRPGEPVTFRVILRNHEGRRRNLYVGYSTGGVDLESGAAFEILAPGAEKGALPAWHVGFCGTGAGPLFTTLPAYGERTFRVKVSYQPASEEARPAKNRDPKRAPVTHACYTFNGRNWLSIAAPDGERHRFRVRIVAPEGAAPVGRFARFVGKDPAGPAAVTWTGTALSNEVELAVRPAR